MKRILLLFAATLVLAQSGKRVLDVDWIMQGPALYGWTPAEVRWSRDSSKVFFSWKRHDSPLLAEPDTYSVNRDGSALRKLSEEEAQQAPPYGGQLSRDRSATVFVDRGDAFVYDHVEMRRRDVTKTTEAEANARFHGDAKHVTYRRGDNLFLHSLEDGSVEQVTNILPPGSKPPREEEKGTESQEYLKKAERELLGAVAGRAKKRDDDEARRKRRFGLKPWILPARHSVLDAALTSDGKWVIVAVAEKAEKAKTAIVPNFVTESSYTEDIETRNRVGDAQERRKLAILNRETGEHRWVESKDRLLMPVFSHDGERALVHARSDDNKDTRLYALDPAAPSLREIAADHDDAWVRFGLRYGHLDDGRVWFLSERDGWAHLYAVPFAGGEAKQLTSGKWEIRDIALSDDRRVFYLTTSEATPAEDQVYALSVDGGDRKRITTEPGGHEVTVSPDGSIADVHGYANRPPELFVRGKRVTESPSPEFATYPWIDPPIVEIPARDGAKVPARIYKPANWRKGGPLVIFVHGAGYLQNAHKRWSQYSREYLFHHLLMDRGYLVLDLDYRASAGYGRDWRTAVYRHMGGGKDLDDQVDAARWAIREHGVDPKRVGIYGGSYGGLVTLMAMFQQPEVFAAGAALRPVTDYAHYNHGYTSNILNTPQSDPEAFRRSSPIYFASGLRGPLLICHGMVDINVHYQDSVRLVQKLIELRKENWEFASYPAEDHGFVQPTSWADEYKRILRLFETNLRR
jgi:dipeptidyl aminopeptidase/acylaminoacyl peptidase